MSRNENTQPAHHPPRRHTATGTTDNDVEANTSSTRTARDAAPAGPKTSAASQRYAAALGARLRAIRHQRGLTLRQVEQEANGRIKAVVVGSYERAERAVTVVTLAELARVYGVRTDELLPHHAPQVPPPTGSGSRLRIDLQQLAALPEAQAGPLARYATIVRAQRDDHHSTVLTLREQDLHSLAVVYDMTPGDLTQLLTNWKILTLDP